MKLLFFDKLTLETRLSVYEVHQRLQHYVLKRDNLFNSFVTQEPQHIFEGRYSDESFLIRRIINYRNHFLPMLEGNYELTGNRTRMKIKMRLPKLLYLIFPLIIIILTGIFYQITSKSEVGVGPEMYISLAMPLLFYLIVFGFFRYEVKRAQKLLIRIFEAEEMTRSL
ncbi:MAG: hypothetical protein MUC87_11060 [Bacteroidia bacterium]|jgi:hypothetical protein|nr:hypothetical protein [Bacteroidia bacterium]